MIHFKDNKNKSALSTRWAQMSKQEQIIEKKKMEIQAKLEAQKNAAALAAQAKLSNPASSDDSGSKNIFSNDGSFMSQYKALLEKQSKEKQEKEEKEKQERQEKNEELQRKKNEAKQKSEQSSQEVDYDSDQNFSNDRQDHQEGRHRERNRRWDRSRNRGHSPFTPTVEDRKPHDTNHIPSLMQLSVKPPDRSPNRSRWNRDDSDSNDDYERKTKQEFDSDSTHAPDNINSQPGPDFMSGPMGPRPMGPGLMGPGPMGGHGPMGPGPMGYSPGPMGRGQMGHMPMGPRPMGPGPMGPGPMGAGPMGPGPMGHGPMGPRPMGPGPMRPGSMGPGQMGHSSGMMPPGTSNNNAGPGQNVGNNMSQNMGPTNSNMPGNSNNPNMPQHNMGPGNSNMPPNMGQGNSNMPPNMGPGNLNRPQSMGPGNPNMPPNMGPGNSSMPPMPFMGGPPNFPMPPNFMGPNGPRGPCGPMPPNMCGPNFRGPRPNGPMPPFFPPNGPPNSMMPPNMNNDQRFMGPQPPFGPNGPNFGPNRPNFGPNGPNFGPNGPNFGPNNMGNMQFMPPNSMPMPPPGNEQNLDSMKHSSMRPNEHENKKADVRQNADSWCAVLSADTFQSIHRAASEVASNGDHWESVLKAMNSQDQSLWFLHNTNSNEYEMYRDLVSKIRNEKQIKKEEINPEDKYEPEFSLEDDDSNDKPYKDDNSNSYQQTQFNLKREASSQSDEETETKRERRKKRKSRWGDDPPVDIKPPGIIPPPPLPAIPGVQLAKIDQEGIKLSTLNRNNQALMQYALTNYGTTNLSAEDWQKCEDNFKLNLLFQDMLKKRQEVERLAAAGKHKYEYDSDEDTAEGTWEHKLRAKEMNATEKWADELTKQAAGKHHIGDFLPPEELKKFMEKYSAVKGGKEPDLSDYKEYKLREDNVGFKMLQKLGWNEGQGLGVEGTGIVEPINKANQPVANMGLGAKADIVSSEDDEFDAYRKRMMLAYRFNRLLRASVARHWSYFRRDRPGLIPRGRSVSDADISSIVDADFRYLELPVPQRRSRRSYPVCNSATDPAITLTSAGGSSSAVGAEEASDGSDAERSRRHHLRVPTLSHSGQSTGNFASSAAGGGCGAPRSAPATPLQLEPHPRSKHDKHAVKPLSGSAPSVRSPEADTKLPSKSRQKKFQRHFPQVGPEERVLNYYSCALVGDLLLQGHLYITKNYFAFYSNVFGYVTKLLIPTTSVLRITKEKVARIIPNAVGVCTRDERHVFGSLLSRDSTYKLMMAVWKSTRAPELAVPKPQELRTSEVEASEYSAGDDSSSGGADHVDGAPRPEPEAIIAAAGAAVIQPALLTGGGRPRRPRSSTALSLLAALLACSALYLAAELYRAADTQEELSGEELYGELARWRSRLHGRATHELRTFLTTNLMLLTKVRQSLEALSGVILADMAVGNNDVPESGPS
ncbi:uncharacterized protein LOC121734503 [Aricia agestis]|uniref:uncharacterized protein LOC121734503 n=1 Tax=Aricia agestis TaxID=91739 RepID=UPI001C206C99|nr:uncharacterized protein LOC121734503 [Aricia agestis]